MSGTINCWFMVPIVFEEYGGGDTFRLEVDAKTKVSTSHIHTPEIIPGKEAGCTETGLSEGSKCSSRGETIAEQEVLPALGHTPWTWTVTKPATTESEGIETRTCSRCGTEETRPIAKLEPKPTDSKPTESKPTSTETSAKPGTSSSTVAPAQTVKKAQPMTVKVKKPSVKASKLTKKKQTIKKTKAFTIKNAKGTVTFKKKSGSKKLTINSKGVITVKKGTKKGTYKIKVTVTAAGNDTYAAGSKTVTVKVAVK